MQVVQRPDCSRAGRQSAQVCECPVRTAARIIDTTLHWLQQRAASAASPEQGDRNRCQCGEPVAELRSPLHISYSLTTADAGALTKPAAHSCTRCMIPLIGSGSVLGALWYWRKAVRGGPADNLPLVNLRDAALVSSLTRRYCTCRHCSPPPDDSTVATAWMTLTDMCARQAGLVCSRPGGSTMLAISSRFRTYVQQVRAWGGGLGPQPLLPVDWH
jgi:hypothetical protein